jgi:hypothetical protein
MAYGTPNPAWDAMLTAWRTANPGATRRYGGGPGDVGFGPGVLPDWAAGGFTPLQQASVQSVAGNPNLTHGWQASPIPQWQIDAQYPGGSGWQPGVTPTPPGWQGETNAPASAMHAPGFLGPPSRQGGGGNFVGPPVHQGSGFPAYPKDKSEARRRVASKLYGNSFTRGKL